MVLYLLYFFRQKNRNCAEQKQNLRKTCAKKLAQKNLELMQAVLYLSFVYFCMFHRHCALLLKMKSR